MENARVALVESNQYVIELIEALIKRSCSQIVAEAHSYEEAATQEFLDSLEAEAVDVAIVDQGFITGRLSDFPKFSFIFYFPG